MQDNFDTVKNQGTYNGRVYNDHNEYLRAIGLQGSGSNSSGTTSSPSNTGSYGSQLSSLSNAMSNLPGQQTADFNTFYNTQKAQTDEFLNRYKGANTDTINNTYSKYHIPDQVAAVNALDSRIQDLKTNSSSVGGGGYANADQVDSAVNTRYLPQFETGINNLTTSSAQANNEIGQQMAPYQSEGNALASRLASQATGFTSMEKNQLDSLLQRYQTLGTLSTAEMERISKLAELENTYKIAQLQNQYKTGPSGLLFNTQTGRWEYPSTSGGSRPPLSSFNQ